MKLEPTPFMIAHPRSMRHPKGKEWRARTGEQAILDCSAYLAQREHSSRNLFDPWPFTEHHENRVQYLMHLCRYLSGYYRAYGMRAERRS